MADLERRIQKLVAMLDSPKAGMRYEACEYLRVLPAITAVGMEALEKASHDPDAEVAGAARRALEVHRAAEVGETGDSAVEAPGEGANDNKKGSARVFEAALLSAIAGYLASVAVLLIQMSSGKYGGGLGIRAFMIVTIPAGLLGLLAGAAVGGLMRVRRFTVGAVIALILAGALAGMLPFLCILFLPQ